MNIAHGPRFWCRALHGRTNGRQTRTLQVTATCGLLGTSLITSVAALPMVLFVPAFYADQMGLPIAGDVEETCCIVPKHILDLGIGQLLRPAGPFHRPQVFEADHDGLHFHVFFAPYGRFLVEPEKTVARTQRPSPQMTDGQITAIHETVVAKEPNDRLMGNGLAVGRRVDGEDVTFSYLAELLAIWMLLMAWVRVLMRQWVPRMNKTLVVVTDCEGAGSSTKAPRVISTTVVQSYLSTALIY